MNKKITCTFLILNMLAAQLHAQPYPSNYFAPPLDSALILAGTFGEIRTDHFHSGIDFSTQEKEGKAVHAAADGYVSRIKISAGGFGKALYITHPNGFVTVYGHLKKFRTDIQQLILKLQYEQKTYDVELLPKPKEIKVKKGETIAWSGSTGGVAGPHLHFEIRDEKTEEPINPLLFGFHVEDTIPPAISNVRIFPVAGGGILNTTDTATTYTVVNVTDENGRTKQHNFTIRSSDYAKALGNIGFGIETTDHQQNSDASLGIYSVSLKIDSQIVYEFKMDRINFTDTRYVNAHIDYLSKIRDNLTIQRCFLLPANHLKIYPDTAKKGYVYFFEDGAHPVEFVVKDFNGNTSTCNFSILSYNSLSDYPYQLPPDDAVPISMEKGIAVHKSNLEVIIPAGAVYETAYFLTSESPQKGNSLAPVFHVGDRTVPIHTSIQVGIKPKQISDTLKSKAVLVSMDAKGNYVSEGGTWNENFLTSKVRHFGDFTLAVDTTPPTVIKEYLPGDLNSSGGAVVQFRIGDNLSGIKSYNATLDGKWLLMEYNKHDRMITGDVSEYSHKSQHRLDVEVMDEKGNVTKVSVAFTY